MTTSRRTQLVRFCSFREVGVQRMDPPVSNWKKKRPTIAVEAAGRSKDRSMRLGFQELGLIKNLNWKSMEEKEDDSGCSILTFGSPYIDDDDQVVDYSFGVFLKSCSLCKKRITRNMDIFMYGYLKAFCSPECREVQIENDESLRPPSPEPTLLSTIARMVGASNASKLSSPESGLSANVNNHSVSIFD